MAVADSLRAHPEVSEKTRQSKYIVPIVADSAAILAEFFP